MKINVEQFYSKYGPMVLRRCRALLRNEEQALDAMQEVFVRVLQKSDVLDDQGAVKPPVYNCNQHLSE